MNRWKMYQILYKLCPITLALHPSLPAQRRVSQLYPIESWIDGKGMKACSIGKHLLLIAREIDG